MKTIKSNTDRIYYRFDNTRIYVCEKSLLKSLKELYGVSGSSKKAYLLLIENKRLCGLELDPL